MASRNTFLMGLSKLIRLIMKPLFQIPKLTCTEV